MPRLKKSEARQVIDEELERLGLGFAAFEVKDGFRPGANDLTWWHAHTPVAERAETKYNLAHLRAYVRIAREESLPAGGIPLVRQRLWMDRSVISRLERDGYLEFNPALHATFSLTQKGRAWMADGKPEI